MNDLHPEEYNTQQTSSHARPSWHLKRAPNTYNVNTRAALAEWIELSLPQPLPQAPPHSPEGPGTTFPPPPSDFCIVRERTPGQQMCSCHRLNPKIFLLLQLQIPIEKAISNHVYKEHSNFLIWK